MSNEEIKEAVLAECKRLWDLRRESVPNSLYNRESNPKNFVDGLHPLCVTPDGDGWQLAYSIGNRQPFTFWVSPTLSESHNNWEIFYRLLGLNVAPFVNALKSIHSDVVAWEVDGVDHVEYMECIKNTAKSRIQ